MKQPSYTYLFFYLSTILISSTFAEKCFQTHTLFGRMLQGRSSAAALYDGKDNIYITGGMRSAASVNNILSYRIALGIPRTVANFPENLYVDKGTAQITNSGDIYFIGALTAVWENTTIYHLTPNNPSPVKIAEMPTELYAPVSAYDGSRYIYILGGIVKDKGVDHILRYDTFNPSETPKHVAKLPYYGYGFAAAWVKDSVYLFGGFNTEELHSNRIIKFTPAVGNKEATTQILDQKLVSGIKGGAAVAVGDVIYVLGGSSYIPARHFLTKFNTVTGQIQHFEVNLGNAQSDIATAYVAKSHRIYIFGGSAYGGYSSQIRYIQLSHKDNCTFP